MATHDNPSFGREKVSPGVAYIKSPAYKARFGSNEGNWLVVTSGGTTRLKNLMRQAREKAQHNASLFFFATFEQLVECEILTAPIWWQVDQNKPKSLLSS